eukprot:2146621-Pleurochrysis_carterae.AAC.5
MSATVCAASTHSSLSTCITSRTNRSVRAPWSPLAASSSSTSLLISWYARTCIAHSAADGKRGADRSPLAAAPDANADVEASAAVADPPTTVFANGDTSAARRAA